MEALFPERTLTYYTSISSWTKHFHVGTMPQLHLMRGALFKHDPDGQSVRTSRGQPQVNCEYVIASSDDEIYFLSANGRQSMRADQDHHS